ncbi:MAG: alkaline phosphatase family protein [Bacteroidaceae bacterium]|nr:alkaline phosphatase family protein [Bacteroidaceae bacterium]
MERKTLFHRHILLFVTALSATMCQAQTSVAPRLLLSVVVDQLRSDLIETFMPLYCDGGFKKLLSEGRVYEQAQYPFANPDRSSAVASLYTGCSPYQNGIVGERCMNRTSLRPEMSVRDNDCTGIMTDNRVSPRGVCVSTLADELKVGSDGKSLVISIAPFADAAVFAAGHDANAAVWIDDKTGRWCTSSYYRSLPPFAASMNSQQPLSERIKYGWTPVSDLVGNFNYLTSRGMKIPFNHHFKGDSCFVHFKTSALVNEWVGRTTSVCLQSSGLGIDDITDLLSVTFYAGNYKHASANAMPMEIQDTYVRLDYALASLIKECEQLVGKERLLVMLTSTGYCDGDEPSLERFRIPTGTFSMVRAASLLNMYLSAVYGNEQWVETHYRKQIFLNHKLIESKGVNIAEMLERCSDFLIQMSGVEDVYTSHRLSLGAWTPGIRSLRNSINPKLSGDIILDVQPGWHVVDEDKGETSYESESLITFPVIFYGGDVEAAKVSTAIETDCVAPTISRAIRIRAPNACAVSPMRLREKY